MWPAELLRRDPAARRLLIASILCGALASIAFALWTILLARVIAAVFIDGADLAEQIPNLLAMVGLVALQAVALKLRRPLAQRASNSYRRSLRTQLLTLAIHRAARGDTRSSAEHAALVGDAVDDLDEHITEFLPALALAAVVPLVVTVFIAVLDPWTTVVLGLAGPLLIALLAVIGRRTRDLAEARFEELAWLGSLYADLLGGLATLRIFGREHDALDTVTRTSAHFGSSTMKVLRSAFQTSLVIEWAATASTALVAVEVSLRLVDRRLSFATALAVLLLTPEFFLPLRRLAGSYHAGQSGAAALSSIGEFIGTIEAADTQRTITNPDAPAGRRAPVIEFDSVHFTHTGREIASIENLSFTIGAGEILALDGPSGSGKTTATLLLLGFERPDAGRITIDGEPLDRSDLRGWHAQVAWVPQNPTILSRSIGENIRLGRRDATRIEVEEAARLAGIDGFIDSLPDGYDTVVGADGARLSGGQRQRIALARALLLDAPMMILDEFTAHLDPATEALLLDTLPAMVQGRTVLLISHRPSVLQLAHRIVTMPATAVMDR